MNISQEEIDIFHENLRLAAIELERTKIPYEKQSTKELLRQLDLFEEELLQLKISIYFDIKESIENDYKKDVVIIKRVLNERGIPKWNTD